MNELNQWEKQLGSWIPRPPSAGIKARLFSPAPVRLAEPRSVFWLAPAVACALLVLALLAGTQNPSVARANQPIFASILSNQNCMAFLGGRPSQVDLNVLRRVTFAWTNKSVSNSIIGFTPLAKPND